MKRGSVSRLLLLFIAVCLLLSVGCGTACAQENREVQLALTPEERAYVEAGNSLRLGYVVDRVPVSCSGEDGELSGISRYIFDRIQQISGLKFTYIPLPAGPVTYDFLQSERIDLVSSVEFNEENRVARGILLSDPYMTSRKVVVTRNSLEFDPQMEMRAAISTGSQTLRKVLGNAYPNFLLEDYDSVEDCFEAVKSGEADLMIQNQYVAEYWMKKPAYEQMKVIPVPGMDEQLCFSAIVAFGGGAGVPEEQGQVLIGILNKAIQSLTEDELGGYIIQAIMENQYHLTLRDFLYRYRYAVGVLCVSALVIAVLAVLLTRQRILAMEDRADAKAQGQFLSAMSHEIRTPLNGLIGLNYLMGQRLDDPERLRVYLRQSTATARYLLSLVNDVLDLSSLQNKKVELDPRPLRLDQTVSTVAAMVEGPMAEKQLHFETETEIPWPCVEADEVRIQQVLLNLLDNARKFTPAEGRVTLRVSQKMLTSGQIQTRAEVEDTGRGMSEEFQKRAFQFFARELEDTVSKGNQGTGLGLPVCRSLAELMGGSLTFTSEKGVGSRFVFTFPARQAEEPRDESGGSAAPEGRRPRVLIAEDNELNGEIMMELLDEAGYEPTLACNGREALEVFRSAPVGAIDGVLMDLLMPEMDGFQAAAAIRALDRPDAATVKIIACTANSSDEDREKAEKSGMNAFLTKPIDITRLMDALSSL